MNDNDYINRAVQEYINLKNLSIKEIIYKLQNKGIDKELLEEYIDNNKDELEEYEKNSAKNLYNKKIGTMDEFEIKQYLIKKGYRQESIENILR